MQMWQACDLLNFVIWSAFKLNDLSLPVMSAEGTFDDVTHDNALSAHSVIMAFCHWIKIDCLTNHARVRIGSKTNIILHHATVHVLISGLNENDFWPKTGKIAPKMHVSAQFDNEYISNKYHPKVLAYQISKRSDKQFRRNEFSPKIQICKFHHYLYKLDYGHP